jgi:hypothetical protein
MNTQAKFWNVVVSEAKFYSVGINPNCEGKIRGYISKQTCGLPPSLPDRITGPALKKLVGDAELRVRTLTLMMITRAKETHSPVLREDDFDTVHEILCTLFPPLC